MDYDKIQTERVHETISAERVEFINLQFTDMAGIVKSVTIPVEQWQDALEHGVWFDGSSIEGFARIAESDMLLWPDLSTFNIIPWEADQLVTARCICDVYMPTGEPFAGDPRYVLKRALKDAAEMGFDYFTGPELEFFLFKRGPNGEPRPIPQDEAGYFDVSTDQATAIRRQMVKALEAFGIKVEALHHEVAVGQHEIDFEYGDALRTADNAITLRMTLKAIAQRNGLYATFMPKPIAGINGSGMHVHQSLWLRPESGHPRRNAFVDRNSEYGLSAVARAFIAGQLAHAQGLAPIIAPLVNSYKRLVPGYEAPVYLSWGRTNRSALIRVPKVSPNRIDSATRIELRCPDPTCNPYLGFAVMLQAGLDGIRQDLEAPAPAEENLYHLDSARHGLQSMPGSLGEALEALKNDELIQAALGSPLYERYVEAKQQEWDNYRLYVSQWELDRYLPIY